MAAAVLRPIAFRTTDPRLWLLTDCVAPCQFARGGSHGADKAPLCGRPVRRPTPNGGAMESPLCGDPRQLRVTALRQLLDDHLELLVQELELASMPLQKEIDGLLRAFRCGRHRP